MKLLTLARDLQRRRARERQARFVAEGVRTVEVLLSSSIEITGALVTASLRTDPRGDALFEQLRARGVPVQEITEPELASAAGTEAPQGVLAIAVIPRRELSEPAGVARYLVLDGVQDPGNVGTLIRTAAALGVTSTIALPGTVDLWNAKVVRSTMGALFTHDALQADWDSVSGFLESNRILLWTADASGVPIEEWATKTLPDRLALVVGNEGAGVSPHVHARADASVAIAMSPDVESLNVAVATGILLHALRPRSSH